MTGGKLLGALGLVLLSMMALGFWWLQGSPEPGQGPAGIEPELESANAAGHSVEDSGPGDRSGSDEAVRTEAAGPEEDSDASVAGSRSPPGDCVTGVGDAAGADSIGPS